MMSALTSRLFLRSPRVVKELLLDVYGARMRRLRYGGHYSVTLASLLETQYSAAEVFASLQQDRLVRMVGHAATTVPLYRRLYGGAPDISGLKDLEKLPIVRKTDILEAGAGAFSTAVETRQCVEIHTGGTTGSPLTVRATRRAIQENYAFFERLRGWARTPFGVRVATFAGRVFLRADSRGPFSVANRAFNARMFSSYHISPATIPKYLDELAAWQPELIDAYPSSLAPLARAILSQGDTRVRPLAVITSSETLSENVRADIENAFACRVYDHYGAAEMAALITQCEHGTYHVNPEYGIVELVDEGRVAGPGGGGEIVATGFINPAMPLVRYATGDWARWSDTICGCGRRMPAIAEVGGRMDDVIVTPDGRLIGRLDPIFKVSAAVFEARIVQDGAAHLRLEIAAAGQVPKADIEAIIEALQARVGRGMAIDVHYVAAFPRTARGKFRSVVNEYVVGGSREGQR